MNVFPTTYSSLSTEALLQLVISNYKVPEGSSITYIKRGFNDTYLIAFNEEKYILRVYKYNWRNKESIETELKLLNYLNENTVLVSIPILDNQSNYIQTIHAAEGIRYAVLFSYAVGEQVKKLSLEQAFLLGQEIGKIHALTQSKDFGITARNYDIEYLLNHTLRVMESVLINHKNEYNYLLRLKEDFLYKLQKVDKSQLSIGICHGDLQAENIHITQDNQFTFFDFDFFGMGYLAYDIGVFIWYDHKNKTDQIINQFLKGYQKNRPLTEIEIALLPYFSTLRALFQMTMYCEISNGKQLPLWPAQQVADFIKKVNNWIEQHNL